MMIKVEQMGKVVLFVFFKCFSLLVKFRSKYDVAYEVARDKLNESQEKKKNLLASWEKDRRGWDMLGAHHRKNMSPERYV
jgi:hypothetical protein